MTRWNAFRNQWEKEGREHPFLSRLMLIALGVLIFLTIIFAIISLPIPPATH
jgi:hypothetical protein